MFVLVCGPTPCWPSATKPLTRRPLPACLPACRQVIVLWTANTERYSEVIEGLNDTADNLMKSIEKGEAGE